MKLTHDTLLSKVAFNCNLRHYNTAHAWVRCVEGAFTVALVVAAYPETAAPPQDRLWGHRGGLGDITAQVLPNFTGAGAGAGTGGDVGGAGEGGNRVDVVCGDAAAVAAGGWWKVADLAAAKGSRRWEITGTWFKLAVSVRPQRAVREATARENEGEGVISLVVSHVDPSPTAWPRGLGAVGTAAGNPGSRPPLRCCLDRVNTYRSGK